MSYKKKLLFTALLLLTTSFFSSLAQAKTVVLIHGYMANGQVWQYSGVLMRMQQLGWPLVGRYGYDENYQIVRNVRPEVGNAVVTVELPWQASIENQAELLDSYLKQIYQDRREPLVLVGHSAGGVVARYGLVKYGRGYVESLITIASPHLGTPMADLAVLASDSPLGFLMQDLGDSTLLQSRALFADLVPARQGSFLAWLNQQGHPDLAYYSIVRAAAPVDLQRYDKADLVVPAAYQDMNNVPALNGKSQKYESDGGHALVSKDADRVIGLIK